MRIRDIILACENVKADDDVMLVFKVVNEETKRVDTMHRVKIRCYKKIIED